MTGTVTEYLTTKSSVYITLLILFGCTAPFIHIIYGINDTKGMFGYTYMSSFLNAIGRVCALLCASLFIKFSASKVNTEYKKVINFGANMFLYVACFFMIVVLVPKKQLFGTPDFPSYYYWVSMLVLSVSSGIIFSQLQKAFIASEEKLKKSTINLIALIGDIKVNHYYKIAKKGIENDLTKEEVEIDSLELEEKMFSTFKTVVKNEK